MHCHTIQDRTPQLRDLAMDAWMDLIHDLKSAAQAGKTDPELAQACDFQRKAQFLPDFVEAENSSGFHAPQESMRILGESLNHSRLGQVALRSSQSAANIAKPASAR
jgi:nitrite reductase (cytochrome c-552)